MTEVKTQKPLEEKEKEINKGTAQKNSQTETKKVEQQKEKEINKETTQNNSQTEIKKVEQQKEKTNNKSNYKTKLYVGNISFQSTEESLSKPFQKYGEIKSANIVRRGERSLGYGFLEMSTHEGALKAIECLHQTIVDGREIIVEFADPNKAKRRRNPQYRSRISNSYTRRSGYYPYRGNQMQFTGYPVYYTNYQDYNRYGVQYVDEYGNYMLYPDYVYQTNNVGYQQPLDYSNENSNSPNQETNEKEIDKDKKSDKEDNENTNNENKEIAKEKGKELKTETKGNENENENENNGKEENKNFTQNEFFPVYETNYQNFKRNGFVYQINTPIYGNYPYYVNPENIYYQRKKRYPNYRKKQNHYKKNKVPSETTIFLNNIPFKMVDQDLLNIFKEFNPKNAKVVTKYGKSRGFGFVEFEDSQSRDQALKLNETEVGGRTIYVKLAYHVII
ncbi:eukaryotic translation initiation factor 4b/4h [Anaeramoeba flamelloides]|uniref:Eukaryotic translation initiation factor 4b/4h n=1 Tax=Anaeramoeba flamelloides TaxID=1746091 RepID=A0ABQ8Z3L0_9EUKA|nr:eukaryotic translation initiation factor 4b/4h [Anaeramoeba flamelloides]